MKKESIELFYWPTPNGWKASIMLEECGLPYKVNYVNIGEGEQFEQNFLTISPNNRIPAIIDHHGEQNRKVSVFESGAILLYLAKKTGKLYHKDEQMEILQWLFWQVGGLGPMAGQAHHFRQYAKENVPYAIDRYTNECERLYGVMNTRLQNRPYLAGKHYSIADIACVGWASLWQNQGQNINNFPNLKKWLDNLMQRPAVLKGMQLGSEKRNNPSEK